MKKIGIITYSYPHLKTEQLLTPPPRGVIGKWPIISKYSAREIKVYALPFLTRKRRDVFFSHRPDQANAISPDVLCKAFGIEYVSCSKDTDIDNDCDIYIIAGAGILSGKAVSGKTIVNCHPGIIPAARGLDSFKWSIFNGIPLGNTLHYIDEGVDSGKVIGIMPTPIFITDSLETLARRHYENEIKLLSSFDNCIASPQNDFAGIESRDATMRMPFEIEVKMARLFDEYKEKYALPYSPLNTVK